MTNKLNHTLRALQLATLVILSACSTTKTYDCSSAYWDLRTDILIATCEQEAGNGNTDAMLTLSEAYFQGLGVDANYERSAYWLKQVADRGICDGQAKYGAYQIRGTGVPKNLKSGIQSLMRAEDVGCKASQQAMQGLNEDNLLLNRQKMNANQAELDWFDNEVTVEKLAAWHSQLFKLKIFVEQAEPAGSYPDIQDYGKHFFILSANEVRTMGQTKLNKPKYTFTWEYYLVPKTKRLYFPDVLYAGKVLRPRQI